MLRVIPPAVYVRDTGTSKGRGVFAAKEFHANEVVEIAPVVIVPNFTTETTTTSGTTLRPAPGIEVQVKVKFVREFKLLLFNWNRLANVPGTRALALGYGSLYNSANPASMRYDAHPSQLAMRFIADRDIQADEELTVNYDADGGGAEWKDHNWFVRHNIEFKP